MQTDPELGQRIRRHLEKLGIETPMKTNMVFKLDDGKSTQAYMDTYVFNIMTALGLDMSDDSLKDTPHRVSKMYCEEIFSGLDYDNFPKCTTFENKAKHDEVVLERNCILRSMCEHHLLPIYGKVHIGYIPGPLIIGISKLPRIASFFAARPQVQERLVEQIFAALTLILQTDDVLVIIEADHYCSKLRGIKDHTNDTVTSKVGGRFLTVPALRQEALLLIGRKS